MSTQNRAGVLVLGAIVLALLGLGWFEFNDSRHPKACEFCRRPLQDKLRAVVEMNGQRRDVCCPQCAVSESRQERKPIRLISVRDFSSGKNIDPKQAWYVNESHALACTHDGMPMNEMKHSETLAFDRCSPGAFAFANKQDAELFVTQNGGHILTMEQLLAGASSQ
jgi:hypothetical protein